MADSISKKLDQMRLDYKYVSSTYGEPIDFTGSGMEAEQLDKLLESPSKQTAFDCYKERLHEVYENGYAISDRESKTLPFFDDERLQEIGDRYLLPVPELS